MSHYCRGVVELKLHRDDVVTVNLKGFFGQVCLPAIQLTHSHSFVTANALKHNLQIDLKNAYVRKICVREEGGQRGRARDRDSIIVKRGRRDFIWGEI